MATKYAPNANKTRETALSWVGESYPPGWCLRFQAREIFKVPGVGDYDGDRAADAEDYWKAAVDRGRVVKTSDPNNIPAGVNIMWLDPNRPDYGHSAYSLGDGWMVSTDLPRSGRVGKVRVSEVTRLWGHKLVGYVIVDGNGYTLTPKPKPTTPDPDVVRWCEARFLNLKGDDDAGAKTFGRRAPGMVDDLTRDLAYPGFERPDVIGVCELRAGTAQDKTFTGLMGDAGFEKVRAAAGNGLFVPKGTAVRYRGSYTLPKSVQGEGRAESLLRSVLTANGHELVVGVSHFDYRPGDAMDLRRVEQAKSAASAVKRTGKRFKAQNLEPTHRHLIMVDENSKTWTRDRAFEPAGYKVAAKHDVDAIYVGEGRDVMSSVSYETESNHRVVGAVIGHARHA